MNTQNTQDDQVEALDNEALDNQDNETITLATIKHAYFSGAIESDMQEAAELMGEIQEAGITAYLNFDPEEGLKGEFDLAIVPVSKRGETNSCVAFAQVPSLEAILSNDAGQEFVRRIVQSAIIKKIANPLRPTTEGQPAQSLPKTLMDFIETPDRGASLKVWTLLAKDMVTALKSKGFKRLNNNTLKSILSSTAFAESQYPTVDQAIWVKVINALVTKGAKLNLDTSLFNEWLETRDNLVPDEEELDIDLEDILGAL